jgi:hypothetical protein
MPKNYVIGSGLSEEELKVASFWVRHRIALRRLGYGSLISFAAIFWVFTLWSVLDAYVISYPRESRIPQLIAQNEVALAALQASAPQPIQPSEATVLPTTENRQDFVVEITNPNAQWWAEFTYRFDVGGEQTPARRGFVLPQSRRFLTELGWSGERRALTAALIVDDIRWRRVDPLMVERDYAKFAESRLQVGFENVTYRNDLHVGNQTVGQTTFTLVNGTGYGFWGADITIVLYRIDTPVAVTTITVREIKPNERREMIVNWFENPTAISKTDIRMDVNILDPKAYLPTERF